MMRSVYGVLFEVKCFDECFIISRIVKMDEVYWSN